jgi:hypothetical protein
VLNKFPFSTLITHWVVMPIVATLFCAGSATAQNSSTNYTFVVASGFLCDSGDYADCLAVAKSTNGDTYEISGAGTFDPQNKSVKAAGTFSYKSTNGNVLETGVWIASDFISFASYGIAPAALQQKDAAVGRPQLAAKRLTVRSSLLPTGGLTVFRILLVPLSGSTKTAVLQLNSALGDVPRERSVEGIRLTVEKSGTDFSEEVRGRVMFLSTPSEVNVSAKEP